MTYTLILKNGKRYDNIDRREVERILFDECHYAYGRVEQLFNQAKKYERQPLLIEYTGGEKKPWTVNGVKMNEKCASVACETKGCTVLEAKMLLRGNKLCAEIGETVAEIRQLCHEFNEAATKYLQAYTQDLIHKQNTPA